MPSSSYPDPRDWVDGVGLIGAVDLDRIEEGVELAHERLDTQQTAVDGKQPLDADLTAIAGLDSSVAGALATDGTGWVRKTYAQLKTSLGLTKGDVGLGSVDNTADAAKPVSTAQQTALDGKAATAHAHAGADITSGTVAYGRLPVGTTASTVAAGDDSRIAGAQQASGKGAASGYAGLDAAAKVPIGQLPTGATSSTVAIGDDARLSDARTPTSHAASHASAGSDPVTPAAIGAAAAAHSHVDVQDFTESGTWSKPAGAQWLLVQCMGGGGGGGAGYQGATGTARCGGGGGAGGAFAEHWIKASDVTSTVAVTVPAAAAGGAAATTDDSQGSNGATGGTVTFGGYVEANGGAFGVRGNLATAGAGGGITNGQFAGGVGSGSSAAGSTAGGAPALSGKAAAGGGGGGGVTTGNGGGGGGTGGRVYNGFAAASLTGGTASGGAGNTAGGERFLGGSGGGGGNGSNATVGGTGGAGGLYGAGGGGGAGSTNGFNSGAGGGGAPGFCRVTTYS